MDRTGAIVVVMGRMQDEAGVIASQLALALDHHQAGRLVEAEGLYRRILAVAPDHADAVHFVGAIALQRGDHAGAAGWIRKALELNPGAAPAHSNLGLALFHLGELDEAEACYRRALGLQPRFSDARCNLGILLHRRGQVAEAVEQFEAAMASVAYRPRPETTAPMADAYGALADHHDAEGRPEAAAACRRRAAALWQDDHQGCFDFGLRAWAQGQTDQAAACFERLAEARPDLFIAQFNLGTVRRRQGRHAEAIAHHRRALATEPDNAGAHHALGLSLAAAEATGEAIGWFEQAVARKSGEPDWHFDLAVAYRDLGRTGEAMASVHRALTLDPGLATARSLRGTLLLQDGQWAAGFADYEWRWRVQDWPSRMPSFPQPLWLGDADRSKTLLVHTEQGMGDTLQFIRFVRPVADRVRRVIVTCDRSLAGLLARAPGVDQVVPAGEPLPEFDCHVPLMSLPHRLGEDVALDPADVPYLQADPDRIAPWRKRLGRRKGLAAGLVWRGQTVPIPSRSIDVGLLAPLFRVPGVRWVSLQPSLTDAERDSLPATVMDCGPWLTDWAETASAMALLDLVVVVDTAAAHLAGALGRPAWVLLRHNADWRWMRERDDSPWYPTMRLFRQIRPGDWPGVVDRVAAELGRAAAAR